MSYRVEWTPAAEQQLAAVWSAAADQAGVSAACHALEQRLRRDPLQCGDRRQSSVSRFVVFGPLAVWFEVIVDDNRVYVAAVAAAG